MKSILLSIQPKYCELIASGKKTIEVRKTAPKLETPFKCYIYCTKQKRKSDFITKSENFGCITGYENSFYNRDKTLDCNGKVIGEFVCDKIVTLKSNSDDFGNWWHEWNDESLDYYDMCLSEMELDNYLGNAYGYGWHISALKIYDKPKELGEFKTPPCEKPESACDNCKHRVNVGSYYYPDYDCAHENGAPLTRPPQSWCYVEEI